jgi:hypothetical protein
MIATATARTESAYITLPFKCDVPPGIVNAYAVELEWTMGEFNAKLKEKIWNDLEVFGYGVPADADADVKFEIKIYDSYVSLRSEKPTDNLDLHKTFKETYLNSIRHLGFYVRIRKVFDTATATATTTTSHTEVVTHERCCICLTNERNVLFLPCRHICSCLTCNASNAQRIANCPICRTSISSTIHVYL